jgi:glycosyltransferase involved in cell wall biosynthesis
VVVSDSRPIKRIVERYHAGEIYRSGDPEDFARACLQIFQNPDGYYDRNGEQMDREISWERDEEALLRVYQRMGS